MTTVLTRVIQIIMRMGHSDFELMEAKKAADRARDQKNAAQNEFIKAIEDKVEARNYKAYKRVVNGS